MIEALILSVALASAGAPADSGPAAAVDPGPVQCADAALGALNSPVLAAEGDIGTLDHCSVSVDCGGGQSVSCSGHEKCRGVPRDCASGIRGRVVCDGVVTRCPVCYCQDGDVRIVSTGTCCNCFDSGGELRESQECVNGTWETTSTFCSPPTSSCPVCQ